MRDEGLLLVVSGPSGAGKSTLCKELIRQMEDLSLSVSVTTRNMRQGEKEGVDYFFISQEEYDKMVETDALLEHASIYGNSYGTPREYVMKQLAQGKDVLLEIEMQGALQVKEKFPASVLVFLIPASLRELYNRLGGRGSETPESLARRFNSARSEMNLMEKYDYVVINDELQKAVQDVQTIMRAEKCRTSRRKQLVHEFVEEDFQP